ncbi:MAG: hypothetical protein JXR95_12315 [Deltaproteobacteria bacterium]|nr:hypothetical protein [Deltaproteobacteria bacterium]
MKVYYLKHQISSENLRIIGIFSSMDLLNSAIEELKIKPGFMKFNNLIEEDSDELSGFKIFTLTIDELAFRTVTTKALLRKNEIVYILEEKKTVNNSVHWKVIGAWSDPKYARQTVIKLKKRTEFADDDLQDNDSTADGFYISQVPLDQLDWVDGFSV